MRNAHNQPHMLGKGSYGKVYKALLGGEVVAVKCLLERSNFDQFEHEAATMILLSHQHIVKLRVRLRCCLRGHTKVLAVLPSPETPHDTMAPKQVFDVCPWAC